MIKDIHIHTVIEILEGREGQLACQLLETRNCIATLRGLFRDEEGESETKEPTHPPGPKLPVTAEKKTTASQRKLIRPKKSKYKGVSLSKTMKSGKTRYKTIYWDGKKKKAIHLGSYDSELEAAAVYQDHIGNKDEARKLRDMAEQQRDTAKQQKADEAEQKENNPDRPPAKKKKKTVPEWVCKRCGSKWDVKKPPHCTNCMNDDFREVEKEVE